MDTLLIATTNAGKIREMRHALRNFAFDIIGLEEFESIPPIDETGSTFEQNATLKARGYAAATGHFTLADDSGLEVEALGGRPGVHSARYGPPGATDADRVELLLAEMQGLGPADRRARFRAAIALAAPTDDRIVVFSGECSGSIAERASGSNGFGYDPVFVPDGYDRTFGELPADIKATISHRAAALNKLIHFLPHFTGV